MTLAEMSYGNFGCLSTSLEAEVFQFVFILTISE